MATGFMVRGTPTQAPWVFVIRVIILVLTVIVMGLTAWALYLYTNPYSLYSSSSSSSSCYYLGYYICRRGLEDTALKARATYYYTYTYVSAPALMMFACISTLIIHASVMACDRSIRTKVFRLAVFIAYLINSIFLLSGWAYMASEAGPFVGYVSTYARYGSSYFIMLAASTASIAGLGAVLWVFVIINLVTYGMACSRSEGTQVNAGIPPPMVMQQQQKTDHSVSVMTVPAQPAPVYAAQGQAYVPQPGYVMQGQPGMVQQAGYVMPMQQPVLQQPGMHPQQPVMAHSPSPAPAAH